MKKVRLHCRLELFSEAIFGCGYSIPGEEDISVCQDENGYPFLRGSTWKGLLRESLENLMLWSGGSEQTVKELFGTSGWSDLCEDRRIFVSDMTLTNKPEDPEQCYDSRTFTALENGVVKQGTLRTAQCVRRGSVFTGTLRCAEEDVTHLTDAVRGIKFLGTLRNRGFGRVRMTVTHCEEECEVAVSAVHGNCLAYCLRTELPVIVTDLRRSHGNGYETVQYIPGQTVRGMVINALASRKPEWFAEHKEELLSAVRFLDVVPARDGHAVLPAIKGFYETKEETDLENVVFAGSFQPGKKRAKLGSFCTLNKDTIRYWSAQTSGSMRMKRGRDGEDSEVFENRYLEVGQEFGGYVCAEPELISAISEVLNADVWLGGKRFAGFGKCRITEKKPVAHPAWLDVYGYQKQEEIGTTLYLLAVSPLTMLNEIGEPCGIDAEYLARRLGVEITNMERCSTSVSEYGGYNRTWRCREAWVRMYDRGSLFRIVCDTPPALDAVRALEHKGLGIRKESGFGQILFVRPELLEGITRKEALGGDDMEIRSQTAEIRRARLHWIMENAPVLQQNGLSNSQLGSIQALCEKAIQNSGDRSELDMFFRKNLTERGAKHAHRFEEIHQLVERVLTCPVSKTIGVSECEDDRLGLLVQLFNFSRKEVG